MKQALFVLASLAILQGPVQAQTSTTPSDHTKPHIGALLGYADLAGDAKGGFNYGLDGGFQPWAPISIGLQVTHFQSNTDVLGSTYGLSRWAILPKIAYNFGGDTPIIRSSYVGAKIGAVIDKADVTTAGVTTPAGDSMTRFAMAPMIGFDEPIATNWTAGLDLSYLFVFGPEDNNDSVHFLGAVKYWF